MGVVVALPFPFPVVDEVDCADARSGGGGGEESSSYVETARSLPFRLGPLLCRAMPFVLVLGSAEVVDARKWERPAFDDSPDIDRDMLLTPKMSGSSSSSSSSLSSCLDRLRATTVDGANCGWRDVDPFAVLLSKAVSETVRLCSGICCPGRMKADSPEAPSASESSESISMTLDVCERDIEGPRTV